MTTLHAMTFNETSIQVQTEPVCALKKCALFADGRAAETDPNGHHGDNAHVWSGSADGGEVPRM